MLKIVGFTSIAGIVEALVTNHKVSLTEDELVIASIALRDRAFDLGGVEEMEELADKLDLIRGVDEDQLPARGGFSFKVIRTEAKLAGSCMARTHFTSEVIQFRIGQFVARVCLSCARQLVKELKDI